MARNIEIKARVRDFPAARLLAESVSDSPGILLKQQDTFYNLSSGKLKLREVHPGGAELIFYQRSESVEPRLSEYLRTKVQDPDSMNKLLSLSLGACGQVRKERWLYLVGQTRIHVDRVESLGDFLELEYVLREGEPEAAGRRMVTDLISRFRIQQEDLITRSYVDLRRS